MGWFSKPLPEGVDKARIPPGQTVSQRWPVLHFGPEPKVDLKTWDLKVFGLVEHELNLSYPSVRALPQKSIQADVHCVTSWSRLGDSWQGVAIQQILDRVGPLPQARYVMAHCEFGYTTSIPLSVLNDDDVLLCHGWNGSDLTVEHGFPLRLLVPKLYLWKSAKWLRGLEFMARNRLGFWEQRGYHDGADPFLEQRYW
ncbi:MAG TPA: sulfite oxidase-like oxidoreductase [Candidatus Nitrosotalea sp.]|nr:sulfite oxidase-like oxidoreductase [Candidatus Nitrosotalea sp.]